jgi:hypothetical protein
MLRTPIIHYIQRIHVGFCPFFQQAAIMAVHNVDKFPHFFWRVRQIDEQVFRTSDELQLLKGARRRTGKNIFAAFAAEAVYGVRVKGQQFVRDMHVPVIVPSFVTYDGVLYLADNAVMYVDEFAAPFVHVTPGPVGIALRYGRLRKMARRRCEIPNVVLKDFSHFVRVMGLGPR